MARLMFILGIGWCFLSAQPATAHPQLMTAVVHRAEIKASPKNVDVTIELTIGEIPAFAERLLMDADQDGTISSEEVKAYLDEQSEALQEAVSLSIGDQQAELLFLYDPEIELGGKDTSAAAHIVVRIFYFARLPHGLAAGDGVVLTDRLWSHAPSLASYHVVGQDGVEMVSERDASILTSMPGEKNTLKMCARCLTAPVIAGSEESAMLAPVALNDSLNQTAESRTSAYLHSAWKVALGALLLFASVAVVLTHRVLLLRKQEASS